MNIPTIWSETKLDDTTVRYTSDHASTGPQTFTATLEHAAGGPKIIWDDDDTVPLFLHDRAERALGLTKKENQQ